MKISCTPGPWKMEIYLNEKDRKLPPHIFGLRDNHQVADCCGADDMDMANGQLIAAAPELLEACQAAVIALVENFPGRPLSEANLNAITLCRAACDKVYEHYLPDRPN
jgi:hypothetical protein